MKTTAPPRIDHFIAKKLKLSFVLEFGATSAKLRWR